MSKGTEVSLFEQTMLADPFSGDMKEKTDILLLGIISPYNHKNRKEHEEFALEVYDRLVRADKIVPLSDDIIQEVVAFNWIIFRKIASLDFYKSYYKNYIEDFEGEEKDIEEAINGAINELADGWWEAHYYDLMADVPEYVCDILDDKDHCYEYGATSDIRESYNQHRPNENVKIYKNDAQNIMFPEVHLDQMSFTSSEYTDDELLRTIVINK